MWKRAIWLTILASGLAILLLGACRDEGGSEGAPGEKSRPHPAALKPGGLDIPGFKVERVERRALSVPVKAAGAITFNQRRLSCLTARVPGRVEAVYAFEGDRVNEGQPLLAIFSLDYLSAQQELIQLILQEERARKAGDEEAASLSAGLIASAVRKITLMGGGEEEIRKIRETRRLTDHLLIRAPFSGSLVTQGVVSGDYVETGKELFRLADLEMLWATANIFEKDLSVIQPGMKSEVRVQAYPQEIFIGRLTVIGAVEDAATRTVGARLELANPGGKLKPGMYADVTLMSPQAADVLAVPAAAVRNVDGRSIVFVQEASDRFVPREVRTGRAFDGWLEILEGLDEGQAVATEGSFSLKAEMLKDFLGEEHE